MPWTHRQEKKANCMHFQIEEMYSVPESFLEIEVRNPQTHGEFAPSSTIAAQVGTYTIYRNRIWKKDVHRL